MKYESARAFRQAVEEKLRNKEYRSNISKYRKMIAFERLIMRLSSRWILKGGYALQLRTPSARTTRDIDLLIRNTTPDDIYQSLVEELQQDIGDFFSFSVIPTSQLGKEVQAVRFKIVAKLDNRSFEQFHIDVGYHDILNDDLERLSPPAFLAFADLPSHPILCYSAYQHLAEKVHAIVHTRPNTSSRVKDMVDILIFASIDEELNCNRLRNVIQAVFSGRDTPLPKRFEHIPQNWNPRYRNFVEETDLPFTDFYEAVERVNSFLNPVLNGTAQGIWSPQSWEWKPE